MTLGIILADTQLSFRKPILFGQPLKVGARVTRLGNKSMTMEHSIEHAGDGSLFANGSCVLVAYEYATGETIPIPDHWRQAIQSFEDLVPAA
jgi:acyl-CoA thioester hydrolase